MSRYLAATRMLGALLVLVGLGMAVTALAGGGGPLATGVVIGAAFVLAGTGRMWLARSRPE
jgi:hypothetical protein